MKTNPFEAKVILDVRVCVASVCTDDYGDGDTCGECSSN